MPRSSSPTPRSNVPFVEVDGRCLLYPKRLEEAVRTPFTLHLTAQHLPRLTGKGGKGGKGWESGFSHGLHQARAVLTATKQGKRIRLQGEITARLSSPCRRCNQMLVHCVREPVALWLEPEQAEPTRENPRRKGGEMGEVYPYEGQHVDLAPMIEDALLLEVWHGIGVEEDAKGRCVQCGMEDVFTL